jgi:hypothetical protein
VEPQKVVGRQMMIAKMTSRRRRPDGNDIKVEMFGFSMVYIGKEDKVSLNCPKAGIPDWPWNYHRM